KTGLVSLQTLLNDENPSSPGKFLTRKLIYQILLVPGLPDGRLGGGCFLLPQLPDPDADPPTTLKTSPIRSGKATLSEPPISVGN
ncbi:MAG: hypothetical protein KDM63_07295, partial [Verrucomicrobiae bacterium]|nr:hypothetical protein [Verrucomicrobiae bacterium]